MSAHNPDQPGDETSSNDEFKAASEGSAEQEGQSSAEPPVDMFQFKRQQERIRELESKLNDYDIKFIEARAFVKKMESEVEQIRSRAERDSQKVVDQKISKIFLELIPIADNFELSLKSIASSTALDPSFVQGIRMMYQIFTDSLKRAGLERIKTEGEPFDPNFHEALMSTTVDSQDKDGCVVQELKAGYAFAGQTLRPAQVSVGRFEG